MKPKEPLRVGLLMDSWMVPAWEYRMLEVIRDSSYAELSLVVLNETPSGQEDDLAGRWARNRRIFLYRLFNRFEKMVCKLKPDAFQKKDARDLVKELPVIPVSPRKTKFSDWIEEGDVEKVRGHHPDVLVRMGFRLIKGGILRAAKHGIWSFHHGDNGVVRGGPSGFWEVFERHEMTGSILQILDESIDNGLVIARSWSSTNLYSVLNSRNKYFWKTLSLLPRKLKQLHELGDEEFYERAKKLNPELSFYDHRMYTAPGNLEFIRIFIPHFFGSVRGILHEFLYRHEWMLMHRIGNGLSTSFHRFKKIVPPKDRFWADPHVVLRDDTYYIFFEEWPHDPGTKGHICVMEMDKEGNYTEPVKVLENEYHYAYPLVFEWEGEYYMLPDSAQNGTVDIYRSDDFPTKWSLHKTIMKDIHLVDPTLFEHGGKWWIFGNVKENRGASYSDELFLYYADNPFSDNWTAHPLNPIISDARKARPAGRVLERGGALYRVSQNCARGYGYGLNFHRIIRLDEREYEETDAGSYEPNWDKGVAGVHTLNTVGDLTVIDAKMSRFRFF